MAVDTIVSGGTLTLTQPLASGTNVDFLNNTNIGGALVLKPGAFAVTTLSSGGAPVATSATIGGNIENFQPGSFGVPGDQITIQTLATLYAEMDVAPDASAENALFLQQITAAAQSDDQYFILPDGAVVNGVENSLSLDANSVAIIDEMRAAMFGTYANNTTLTLSFAQRTNPNSNHPFIDGVFTASALVNPCFVAGTRILTMQGELAVERLAAGDTVITYAGEEKAVVWIGRRRIDIARHPRPESVRPIIIEPGALAAGVPARRLVVSPDHALFLDDALVPAKLLDNGRTIRPDRAAVQVSYYHVELAAHDILLAEGAAAESFLDTGHRGVFENAEAPLELHPDLMQQRREAEGCALLCTGGEKLAVIRARIAERTSFSESAGWMKAPVE